MKNTRAFFPESVLSKKVLQQFVLIIVVSSLIGFSFNLPLIKKYFKGEFKQAFLSSEKYPGITFISLPEAEDYFRDGEALFIDSRSREEYSSGHIMGALNLPLEEVKKGVALAELGSIPFEKTLIVYCQQGDCEMSLSLAKILYGRGFKNIKVFQGGWSEWKNASLPVKEGK